MGDDLPRKLYEAWNADGQQDLAWGLLETSKREQWEQVASVARANVLANAASWLEVLAREAHDEGNAVDLGLAAAASILTKAASPS